MEASVEEREVKEAMEPVECSVLHQEKQGNLDSGLYPRGERSSQAF